MSAWRYPSVLLAGAVANTVALYVVSSAEFYVRVATNPSTSPVALALFALIGAVVALGLGPGGWIAAPVAFYLGLAVMAVDPPLGNISSKILHGYFRAAVTFLPFAVVGALAAAAIGRLGWRVRPSAGAPALVAKLAAGAALALGIIAIPVINGMPSPITLCTLRPPLQCIAANMSGAQYVEGDGPTALAWLVTSLVLAPLTTVAGAWLVARGQASLGRMLAAAALLPHALLFFGTYALLPFHPIVFALMLTALAGLLTLDRDKGSHE